MKRPDKYRKRPEFIDIDNPTQGREYARYYTGPRAPSLGNQFPAVNASESGTIGALPRQGLLLGAKGQDPTQTRNRKSPNPLEEMQ